ncbi:hypothetical protein MHYP_G00144600 [Metynnis hypsauchen]
MRRSWAGCCCCSQWAHAGVCIHSPEVRRVCESVGLTASGLRSDTAHSPAPGHAGTAGIPGRVGEGGLNWSSAQHGIELWGMGTHLSPPAAKEVMELY